MNLLIQYYLLEIKYRIIYYALSILNTFIISYICFEEIFYIFSYPLQLITNNSNFIYTNLSEIFFTSLNFSFIFSFFINIPLLYLHIWFFIVPGLYKFERYKLKNFFIISLIFILLGLLCAYFIFIPLTWNYFYKLEINSTILSINLQPKINEYFYNISLYLFFFIGIFHFPLLLYHLIIYKILLLDLLILKRHFIFLTSLILSSIISPPDIFNFLLLSGLIYTFNEIIIFYFIFYQKIK